MFYFFRRTKSAILCGPGEYQVVKCGASGHNVRSRPSLKASPVGMLVLGNHVTVVDHVSYDYMFQVLCLLFLTGAFFEQLMGQMSLKCELWALL